MTEPVSTVAWIRKTRKRAEEYHREAWRHITSALKVELMLGEVLGVECVQCRQIIPWSGRGKHPRYCPDCSRLRRLNYMKSWHNQNLVHCRNYMAQYRKRKRGSPMDREPFDPADQIIKREGSRAPD